MRLRTMAGVVLGWVCGAGPTALGAQMTAARLIAGARAQIEDLNNDSAAVLLHLALEPRISATPAERVRAYILLGIAELPQRPERAREAFRQALLLNTTERADSLRDLASGLLATFNAERARLLTLELRSPADTQVPLRGGSWRLGVRASRSARVTLVIAPEVGAPVHRDSQLVSAAGTFEWNLRVPDGSVVSPGTYVVRVTARDTAGQVAPGLERLMVIETVPIDTQPLPAPLLASAFAPETASVRVRPAGSLVGGILLGAGAVLLAGVGPGGAEKSGDAGAFVAASALAVGGLAGFLHGHAEPRPVPENIVRNQQVRAEDTRQRAAIAEANARARAAARLRLRVTSESR